MKSVDLTPNVTPSGKPKRSFLSLLRSLSGVLLIVGGLSVLLWTVGSRLTSAPSSPQEKTREESTVKNETEEKSPEVVNLGNLPEYALRLPEIKEAYLFAGEKPDVIKTLACYCACEKMGHQNLLDCYFKKLSKEEVIYEEHAANCDICLRETLDTKKMVAEGKDLTQIRELIDQKYQN